MRLRGSHMTASPVPVAQSVQPRPVWWQVLKQAGLLPEASLQEGPVAAMADLIAAGHISSQALAQALAQAFDVRYAPDGAGVFDPLPELDWRFVANWPVCLLGLRERRVQVATADPSNRLVLNAIEFSTGLGADYVVLPLDVLHQILSQREAQNQAVAVANATAQKALQERHDMADFVAQARVSEAVLGAGPGHALLESDSTPVVRFLHQALLTAWFQGASDLHFEPFEDCYRLRFRIDGVLNEQDAPPLEAKEQLTSRIKVMANLDIAERRLPQDGGMKLMLTPAQGPARAVDFRVSTLPTLFGEKVVIRILEGGTQRLALDELGYSPAQKQAILTAIAKPQGMVLMTGPTGSGKTVSLYACLTLLNQRAVNISTVEDPCEIHLSGVNQVHVNERAGLSFAVALRALLRQDPDVLMVGEIRDLETADVALKAAQTGHLVLSTLHTNDAPGVLTRLRHMGVLPFQIAASLSLVTAQRLLRRLCPLCKTPRVWTRSAWQAAGFTVPEAEGNGSPWDGRAAAATCTLFEPVGCASCHQGYKGRLGVYQVMPMSEALQEIVLRDGHATELAAQAAREGVLTLRQAAWGPALAGLTSLAEVLNATPD